MDSSDYSNLGFVEDHSDLEFVADDEQPVDWAGMVMPRGMEHLDPRHPEAYDQSLPTDQSFALGSMANTTLAHPASSPTPTDVLQKYVGRPASEALLGMAGLGDAPLPGGQNLHGLPERALAQEALSPYSGQHASDEAAIAALGGSGGMSTPTGPKPGRQGELLLGAARAVGELPIWATIPTETGPAAAAKVAQLGGGKLLQAGAKAAGSAAEGALLGAGAAAVTGDDIGQSALMSGGLTGSLSLLGSGARALLTPKPKMPVLINRPDINDAALLQALERGTQPLDEMPMMQLESGELIPADSARLSDPTTGKKTWEGGSSFKDAAKHNAAAIADVQAGKALPPQSVGYVEPSLPKTADMGPTKATPQSAATGPITPNQPASINSATPPPAKPQAVPVPPTPVPLPGQLPNPLVSAFNGASNIVNSIRVATPSVGAGLKKWLMSPGVRGLPGVRHIANEMKAARNLHVAMDDSLRAIRSAAGKDLKFQNDFDRALSELADGNRDVASIQADFPDAWKKVAEVVEPMVSEMRQNDQILRTMGYVPNSPSWMTDPLVEEYAARMYLSKTLPKGKWGKLAPQNVVDKGIAYIAVKSGGSAEKIASDVLDMLNSGRQWEDLVHGANAPSWSKPFQHIKSRQNLPVQIRDLLGEIHSGAYRIPHTLATQRSLIAQLQLSREIALNPNWTSATPRFGAEGQWVRMPKAPAYGAIAGQFVHPDVAEAIGNAFTTAGQHTLAAKVMGFMKGNVTIFGGPAPWVHEFFGDLHYSTLAGGLDILHPRASGQAFLAADKAMRDYLRNPASIKTTPKSVGGVTANIGARDMVEALRLGAVDPGFSRAELRASHIAMSNVLERELRKANGDSLWSIAGVFKSVMAAGTKIYGETGRAWDMISQQMRLASYIKLREQFIAKGMAVGEARRMAAQRVIMSFPSPHNLGPGIDRLRSGALGWVAPFTTYLAEDARIHMQLPGRVLSEPDLLPRIAATYGALGAGLYGAKRLLQSDNGISDQEMEAAQAEMTRRDQFFRPTQLGLPFRDEKGRIQFVDMSWVLPAMRLPQGDPNDPIWSRITANALLYPFQGGAADMPLRQAVQAAGGPMAPPEYRMRPGETGFLALVSYLNRSGFGGPTAVTRIADAVRSMNPIGLSAPLKEAKSPEQAAAGVMGFPVMPVTVPTSGQPSPTLASRGVEFKGSLRDLTNAYRSALAQGDQQRATKIRQQIDILIKDMQNVGTKVQAAKEAAKQ